MLTRRLGGWLVVVGLLSGCASLPTPAHHLAIANGSHLRVFDTRSGQMLQDITRYAEGMRLAYRPDGDRLAVGVCIADRVVELETSGYAEQSVPITAAGCPWDVTYAPDGQSLAATTPLSGHLRIVGPQPLDQDMGLPLSAVAYRPGGGEIAVATPQGVAILGPGPAYPTLLTVAGVSASALEYTTDGARLIAGTPTGFVVLDATLGYAPAPPDTNGSVLAITVARSGGWVALVRSASVSVRRSSDLVEVASLTSAVGFRDADFSRDGVLLAVAEQQGSVRVFRAPTWTELSPVPLTGRVNAVAFRPRDVAQRLPVLFVHGANSGAGPTWFEPGVDTSVAAALAANPRLPIDAFYVEMPLHGGGQNVTRSVEDHALDILAIIEGGADSRGGQQVGILNMPAYQAVGRVAVVGYSLGTISTRYYLKTLMGSRRSGAVTVSEFVALASPNHGIASIAIGCDNPNQPDRVARQLCAGRTATGASVFAACGCANNPPAVFTTNQAGDETFVETLNGHPVADSCGPAPAAASTEAPRSRPDDPAGVLYVNLFAWGNADLLVGGNTQWGDCLGRRLARNLAPNAENREIAGVPWPLAEVHGNFPHHWRTICMALRTVAEHAAPIDQWQACAGLTRP